MMPELVHPPKAQAGDRIAVLSPSFAAPGFVADNPTSGDMAARITGLVVANLVGTHAGDERQSTGNVVRVEALSERHRIGSRRGRTELDADGVVDLRHELHVGSVQFARALADPQEVRRAVVRQPGA